MRAHELLQLKSLPLFSEMAAQSLETLLDAALLQQFPAGVVLIHEGQPADFLHVLVDGLVEIFTEQNGVEWGISLINPISTFILAAVVTDQPYLNSARTLANSRILLIPRQRVRAVFDEDIAFARIVARELAQAYRLSVKKLKGYMAPIKRGAARQLDSDRSARRGFAEKYRHSIRSRHACLAHRHHA